MKHGYAAIAMPDLYGVPLPYSGLDEEIEALFGPTVVRRKLLKESSESLESVGADLWFLFEFAIS